VEGQHGAIGAREEERYRGWILDGRQTKGAFRRQV
jgi:hypothetical protein